MDPVREGLLITLCPISETVSETFPVLLQWGEDGVSENATPVL